MRLGVFITAEIAVALHQAEALRVGHAECAGAGALRVDQRAPQPLAVASRDHQAVGVVHLGAKVTQPRRVLAMQKHAGQRRDAQGGDGSGALCQSVAQEQAHAHIDHRFVAGAQAELVSAGGARRVELRVQGQRFRIRRGAFEPECLEDRELLGPRAAGIDRQAARRQAVLLAPPERAKVARAEEDDQLVLVGRVVERGVDPKAGVAGSAPGRRRDGVFAVVVVLRVEADLAHTGGRHVVQLDRLGVRRPTRVKEHQLEGQRLGPPRGAIGAVADVAVGVVLERLERGGVRLGRAVGAKRFLARQCSHVIEAEGRSGAGGQQGGEQRDGRNEGFGKQRSDPGRWLERARNGPFQGLLCKHRAV